MSRHGPGVDWDCRGAQAGHPWGASFLDLYIWVTWGSSGGKRGGKGTC